MGCIIAKRGAPEIEDSKAIQRIVDLLAADPPPKFCAAVRKAAEELYKDSEKAYQRLRKKYLRLKKRGLLPKGGEAGLLERRSAAITDLYVQREATLERVGRDVARVEKEAAALGIDLNGDLGALKTELETRKEELDLFTQGPVDIAVATFRRMGIVDPSDAVAKYHEALEERREIEAKLAALSRVREQRYILRAS